MPPVAYPDTENFAYQLARCEISFGTKSYTAITNITHNQPIEEGMVRGARAKVLKRTRGAQNLGEGNVEFPDLEEAQLFIDDLGDGWAEKIWDATLIYTAPNKPAITHKLLSCRLLDAEIDHSEGADAAGITFPFSFMDRTLNGKRALIE